MKMKANDIIILISLYHLELSDSNIIKNNISLAMVIKWQSITY